MDRELEDVWPSLSYAGRNEDWLIYKHAEQSGDTGVKQSIRNGKVFVHSATARQELAEFGYFIRDGAQPVATAEIAHALSETAVPYWDWLKGSPPALEPGPCGTA